MGAVEFQLLVSKEGCKLTAVVIPGKEVEFVPTVAIDEEFPVPLVTDTEDELLLVNVEPVLISVEDSGELVENAVAFQLVVALTDAELEVETKLGLSPGVGELKPAVDERADRVGVMLDTELGLPQEISELLLLVV